MGISKRLCSRVTNKLNEERFQIASLLKFETAQSINPTLRTTVAKEIADLALGDPFRAMPIYQLSKSGSSGSGTDSFHTHGEGAGVYFASDSVARAEQHSLNKAP